MNLHQCEGIISIGYKGDVKICPIKILDQAEDRLERLGVQVLHTILKWHVVRGYDGQPMHSSNRVRQLGCTSVLQHSTMCIPLFDYQTMSTTMVCLTLALWLARNVELHSYGDSLKRVWKGAAGVRRGSCWQHVVATCCPPSPSPDINPCVVTDLAGQQAWLSETTCQGSRFNVWHRICMHVILGSGVWQEAGQCPMRVLFTSRLSPQIGGQVQMIQMRHVKPTDVRILCECVEWWAFTEWGQSSRTHTKTGGWVLVQMFWLVDWATRFPWSLLECGASQACAFVEESVYMRRYLEGLRRHTLVWDADRLSKVHHALFLLICGSLAINHDQDWRPSQTQVIDEIRGRYVSML